MGGQLNVQLAMFDAGENYQAFVDKFKPEKTTDDCYTPENIYEAVAEWVKYTYGISRRDMLRPFWPEGDFEREEYPEGCCVVDNPPFSILTRIIRFYCARGVRFFLFAPTLTLYASNADVCYMPLGVKITYENGAGVNTSFVTNLETRYRVQTVPELYKAIRRENDANERANARSLPKYSYPDHVLTAAAAYRYSRYGIDFRLKKDDATYIKHLDAMRGAGKDSRIFGGAFLLSERAAAERAAAERAAAERAAAERAAAERAAAERAAATVWELSEREKAIVRGLGE